MNREGTPLRSHIFGIDSRVKVHLKVLSKKVECSALRLNRITLGAELKTDISKTR